MKLIGNHTKDWPYKPLSAFIAKLESGTSVNSVDEPSNGLPRVLKTSCVSSGKFDAGESKTVAPADLARVKCPIRKDAIVISRMNTLELVGACALVTNDEPGVYLPDRLWQTVWANGENVDPRWLAQVLSSREGRRFLRSIASGTSGSMKNVSKPSFLAARVPSPKLPEQRKIADILTTWDEALENLDGLIAAKDRRKKALMQQLLTGNKRVSGATGTWRSTTLSKVLESVTRPTPKPANAFLAAGIRSHGRGVFLKPDFAPADIALDELYEIKAGDLIVNITFAWEGAAAIVPAEADGALVSHRFPTFAFRAGKASRSFFRHYIRTKRFVFDCGLASPGGAGRNRVLSKPAFLKIELMLPPIEEQEAIGEILDTCDAELTLLRRQRDALDLQKRGLMQRLLTGKIRVQP